MDKTSVIGVMGTMMVVPIAIAVEGGDYLAYLDLIAVVIVGGGSAMAVIASNTINNVKTIPKILKYFFTNSLPDPAEYVVSLVSLAEKARREGLLSLEDEIDGIGDEFLKLGMRLVIDGAEPNAVKAILNAETSALDVRHFTGVKMFDDMAVLAPAFGMCGTLTGLVMMMRSLGGDSASVGKGMAAALLTTLYGAVFANAIFLPISFKLDSLNKAEMAARELIIEGVLSIQAGDNPKTLQQKLLSFFPPNRRENIRERVEGR